MVIFKSISSLVKKEIAESSPPVSGKGTMCGTDRAKTPIRRLEIDFLDRAIPTGGRCLLSISQLTVPNRVNLVLGVLSLINLKENC